MTVPGNKNKMRPFTSQGSVLFMPPFDMNKCKLIPHILCGETIQLEPLAIHHYELLRDAANDARIWTYMPMKAHGEFYDAWFQDCLSKQINGTQLTYVIKRLSDHALIGCRAYYDIELAHKKLEVGYGWLTPAEWGTRYNHESLLILFTNAFEEWKFNRIQIATDTRNTKNFNTLKKLGIKQEGELRQHMIHHNGLMTDTVLFSILAEEWPNIKDRLETRLHKCSLRYMK